MKNKSKHQSQFVLRTGTNVPPSTRFQMAHVHSPLVLVHGRTGTSFSPDWPFSILQLGLIAQPNRDQRAIFHQWLNFFRIIMHVYIQTFLFAFFEMGSLTLVCQYVRLFGDRRYFSCNVTSNPFAATCQKSFLLLANGLIFLLIDWSLDNI